MIHNVWLLKRWPKNSEETINPKIYCLEEEWNEEKAKKYIKSLDNINNDYYLLQADGFDTLDELIDAYVPEHKEYMKSLPEEKAAAILTYKGKKYYFHHGAIIQTPTKTYAFLFARK